MNRRELGSLSTGRMEAKPGTHRASIPCIVGKTTQIDGGGATYRRAPASTATVEAVSVPPAFCSIGVALFCYWNGPVPIRPVPIPKRSRLGFGTEAKPLRLFQTQIKPLRLLYQKKSLSLWRCACVCIDLLLMYRANSLLVSAVARI